jgi:hypothetical protein
MSIDVSAALLEKAESGQLSDKEFVDCVRQSLPYAWTVISKVTDDLARDGRTPLGLASVGVRRCCGRSGRWRTRCW